MDHGTHPTTEHEPHNHAQPGHSEHGATSLRTYFVVYVALLVLLVLTVAVAQFDLRGFDIPVAFLIALVKAVLVLAYFMHLAQSSRLTWLIAGAGFAWLALLIVGIISDYISRGWVGQ